MVFLIIVFLLNSGFLWFYCYAVRKVETYQHVSEHVSFTGKEMAALYFQTYGLANRTTKPYTKSYYELETNTVYLQEKHCHSTHLVSLAVTTHECSHALQHQKKTRLSLLRIGSFGLRNLSLITAVIFFLVGMVLWGKVMLTLASLHSLMTLLHEREANRLALAFLQTHSFSEREYDIMKHILRWFLSSYFVTFLSILSLLLVIWAWSFLF